MAITKATASSIAPAAKGDLVAGTATNDAGVLAVGANGTVLTAASGQATGLEWATVAAGANWSLLNSGGTALTGAQTITVSGISGKDKIMAVVTGASAGLSSFFSIRLNGDNGANYDTYAIKLTGRDPYDYVAFNTYSSLADSSIRFARQSGNAADTATGGITFTGCNSAGVKTFTAAAGGAPINGSGNEIYISHGVYNSASTITSISILSGTGNFDAGTIYVYTSA